MRIFSLFALKLFKTTKKSQNVDTCFTNNVWPPIHDVARIFKHLLQWTVSATSTIVKSTLDPIQIDEQVRATHREMEIGMKPT